ncbi:hypothetical protein FC093_03725 [Ilyomonas limi]|uniref:Uncharacterized protein n=1 Tax=Ilyomonas limi TaxID=2575867 RepID=A0A4U3L6G0_9BACT|nr:hypothetical protein [Ilyomonas limi]TKK70815.1 hypothetical protein FC093_03725 [Ilyomonas limi]
MLFKICSIILILIPFLSYSQSVDSWKLYLNEKQLASATEDSIPTVQVHKRDTSALKFVFAGSDTAFIRKVIVMNKQRNGIDSKTAAANAIKVVFNVQELNRLSHGEDLIFYIVKIPANPAKAALVRVAPRPICNLQWIP